MVPVEPKKWRIVVIDDEAGLQKLFRREAERRGLRVLEALTASAGFEAALEGTADIILLDLHLPDTSGLALLRKLKADPRTTKIPVVAWSGSDAVESEAEALSAGAIAYFDKMGIRSLIDKLVRALAGG
jgi:DNA-binding response OmpR family regulator